MRKRGVPSLVTRRQLTLTHCFFRLALKVSYAVHGVTRHSSLQICYFSVFHLLIHSNPDSTFIKWYYCMILFILFDRAKTLCLLFSSRPVQWIEQLSCPKSKTRRGNPSTDMFTPSPALVSILFIQIIYI